MSIVSEAYKAWFLSKCAEAGLFRLDAERLLKAAEADPELARATALFKDWLTVPKHTVAAGETLSGIARKYGVGIDAIMQENGLSSIAGVRQGMQLRIPTGNMKKPGKGVK